LAAQGHFGDPAFLDLLEKLGEGQGNLVDLPCLEGIPKQNHHHKDGDPDDQCSNSRVQ
jgi:hypothetical protein